MNNTKTTKRALLSSVIAMLVCITMLIGTTFAWFTDTASTAVNKIQAGKLDVQLLDENGNSLEGVPLTWQKAAGHTSEAVLWEPGCTYNLKSFKIKNNGNLALKYKVFISGIDGDAKLNEAIEWSYKLADGSSFAIADEGHLLAGQSTGAITISGHMKEEAGNEYQGLSIDGIGITIYATQYASEYDSYGNTYDNNATYRVNSPSVTVPQTGVIALQTNESDPVMVKLPAAALTSNTTATPTSVSLRHNGVDTDSENKTVEFNDLEIVDENGNVIDFSNNTTHTLDITLPVSNIANGTQVKVYHDGNLVAVTTVQDGMITYQVNHLCDVKVVSVDGNENATQSTNDKMTGNRYTVTENLSNKKITHTFNNTKRDAMALYIKGSSANITFDNVDFTLTQGVRVTDSQVKRNFGIFVYDGAKLTFNSGTYNVSGLDTYFMWIQDNTNNSIVTINDGNFISNSQGAMFACYSTTSKLVINGGFFDQSAGNPNLTLQGGKNYRKGEIVVTGGTFVNYNPQEHVANGYKVVAETQNDGKVHYKVVATN